jgi:hypothetical protein
LIELLCADAGCSACGVRSDWIGSNPTNPIRSDPLHSDPIRSITIFMRCTIGSDRIWNLTPTALHNITCTALHHHAHPLILQREEHESAQRDAAAKALEDRLAKVPSFKQLVRPKGAPSQAQDASPDAAAAAARDMQAAASEGAGAQEAAATSDASSVTQTIGSGEAAPLGDLEPIDVDFSTGRGPETKGDGQGGGTGAPGVAAEVGSESMQKQEWNGSEGAVAEQGAGSETGSVEDGAALPGADQSKEAETGKVALEAPEVEQAVKEQVDETVKAEQADTQPVNEAVKEELADKEQVQSATAAGDAKVLTAESDSAQATTNEVAAAPVEQAPGMQEEEVSSPTLEEADDKTRPGSVADVASTQAPGEPVRKDPLLQPQDPPATGAATRSSSASASNDEATGGIQGSAQASTDTTSATKHGDNAQSAPAADDTLGPSNASAPVVDNAPGPDSPLANVASPPASVASPEAAASEREPLAEAAKEGASVETPVAASSTTDPGHASKAEESQEKGASVPQAADDPLLSHQASEPAATKDVQGGAKTEEVERKGQETMQEQQRTEVKELVQQEEREGEAGESKHATEAAPLANAQAGTADNKVSEGGFDHQLAAALTGVQQLISTARKHTAAKQWADARAALGSAAKMHDERLKDGPHDASAAEIRKLMSKVEAGEALAKSERVFGDALAKLRKAVEHDSLDAAAAELANAKALAVPGVSAQLQVSQPWLRAGCVRKYMSVYRHLQTCTCTVSTCLHVCVECFQGVGDMHVCGACVGGAQGARAKLRTDQDPRLCATWRPAPG